MPSPIDDDETEIPFPRLDHASTFSSHLSPDDAFASPPRRNYGGDSAAESTRSRSRIRRLNGEPGGGRRRKRAWKKLMWVKQSCMFTAPISPSYTGIECLPLQAAMGDVKLIINHRSGQLHRSGDLPRESATESSPQTVRLLASSRRLHCYPTTRMLRHHIHRLLFLHLPGARFTRICRQLEQLRHVSRLAAVGTMGLGGGSGR